MRAAVALVRLVHAGAIVSIIALAVLSLVPGQDRPHVLTSGNLEHFVAYAGTGLLIALGASRRLSVVAVPALSAAAALFEVLQIVIPGRGPGVDNWLASSLGAAAGVAIGIAVAHLLGRLFAPQPG
jgi:VanZ family protein